MRKIIILTTAIVIFITMQSCSKTNIIAPDTMDYIGNWAGRRLGPTYTDSIQINLKQLLLVDGKFDIKTSGYASNTVSGNWGINKDTLFIYSYIVNGNGPTGYKRIFSAKLNKDILRGITINDNGTIDSFYLARRQPVLVN